MREKKERECDREKEREGGGCNAEGERERDNSRYQNNRTGLKSNIAVSVAVLRGIVWRELPRGPHLTGAP